MQMGQVAAGIAALKPLVRIGSATGDLLAIPCERLWSRNSPPGGSGGSRGGRQAPLSQQLQRSLTGWAAGQPIAGACWREVCTVGHGCNAAPL